MFITHILSNAYLRLELHIGESGENAREEKKTLNLIKPLSPIERPNFTKLKEKKGCGLNTFLPTECWSSTKVRKRKCPSST
jgi:hypothetical protein